MAVGDSTFPDVMYPVAGFRLATGSAGIKKPGKKDLVIMAFDDDASVAACFTKNAFCAAPVKVAKAHLSQSSTRYLVTNTGNANAGTGEQGLENAHRVCRALADLAGCPPEAVLPYSTGVIGEPLPVDKILAALPDTLADLDDNHWQDAGIGIMTTDTRPKGATRQIELDGKTVTITGISKGAGMIKPNMATMLAYVATDAAIDRPLLQEMLVHCVEHSFNRITVDGDTSTNDAVTLVATGKSGVVVAPSNSQTFVNALQSVLLELAQAIIRDGEGATKFVAVEVDGGASAGECLKVAYAVAESPLVKTALFASDPNWGRILAAIGRAGLDSLEIEKIAVSLDDLVIVEKGGRAQSYTEAAGQAVMEREEITININLGRGNVSETVWTTDFSHDYVTINAEYRT
jgi:glutamate N-acetyltransferase / amino-acid N-acetyltransferase